MHICVYRYIYVDVCIHEIILVTIKTSRYKINKLRGFSYTYLVAQFFSKVFKADKNDFLEKVNQNGVKSLRGQFEYG